MPERIDTYYWYAFDLPFELVHEGDNEFEVTMERHFKAMTADRVLQQVEVRVEYVGPEVPVRGQM